MWRGRRNFFDQIESQMDGGDGFKYGATTALIPSPSTAHIRMDSVNRESMEGHFNLLEDTLKEHDLMNRPAQIYNMDESGMPLDARPPNVVAKRGQIKVRYRQSGKKEQISVIGCANAVGQSILPMVILREST